MSEEQKKDEMKAVEEIMEFYQGSKHPLPQEDIVQILRELQELLGCVPLPVQKMVAEKSGVGPAVVSCLVKMYPSLRAGNITCTVTLCSGGRCGSCAAELMRQLKRELGIDKNGISADGQVALRTRSCLKHCRTAPNVLINGKLYTDVTVQKVLQIVNLNCKSKCNPSIPKGGNLRN